MAAPIDTVLFDLDDTLCRYRRSAADVLEIAFERAGVGSVFEPGAYYDRYREYLERATRPVDLHEQCFGDLAVESGYDRADGLAVARAFREERDQRNVEALPGATATVEALAEEYTLGLVTNGLSAMQRQKLEATGLEDAFETTVYAGEDAAPKPDPEPFDLALDELGSVAERTVYVGNSLSADIAGARAAGLASAWLPAETAPVEPEPSPDYVLESLADLRSPPWR
ncbi:HAD family hydrolase [Natronococcus occultus]|uniref:Haloacid dehalogenase superfamily enzyme, subfamily IA n=1 Tax=Natronococcus occultus SP4 TaxID=694430 RepID=L0K2I3_9EURY|nr:HAD family hydrolase [Natronococcus occultus]AGB39216.1 haloacid dehalogenase superfamily enzyme, subfamily IA [Natronococcus occultus SP4]